MNASANRAVLCGLKKVARMVQHAIFAISVIVWKKSGVPKRRGRFEP